MSNIPDCLALKEDDVHKMLTAEVHIGSENLEKAMSRYIWKRRIDGQYLINIQYSWEKLILAARAIVAVKNPADVCVISARDWGQRAVLKFCKFTKATGIAGRFTPGTFTNQGQKRDFKEPRLLIVTDTRIDYQPLLESSYANIPTIAFCNSDSPLKYVDVAIPCNNAAPHAIGLMYWFLAREVLRMRGELERDEEWEIMPDLFFWRAPTDEDDRKEEASDELGGVEGGDSAGFDVGFGNAPLFGSGDAEGGEGGEEATEEGAEGSTEWNMDDEGFTNTWNTEGGDAGEDGDDGIIPLNDEEEG